MMTLFCDIGVSWERQGWRLDSLAADLARKCCAVDLGCLFFANNSGPYVPILTKSDEGEAWRIFESMLSRDSTSLPRASRDKMVMALRNKWVSARAHWHVSRATVKLDNP